jgi:hypothetical protein
MPIGINHVHKSFSSLYLTDDNFLSEIIKLSTISECCRSLSGWSGNRPRNKKKGTLFCLWYVLSLNCPFLHNWSCLIMLRKYQYFSQTAFLYIIGSNSLTTNLTRYKDFYKLEDTSFKRTIMLLLVLMFRRSWTFCWTSRPATSYIVFLYEKNFISS